MRQFVMPESPCPYCQNPLNRSTDPSSLDSPSPGDIAICICCAGLLKYDKDLKVQKLEQSEIDQIALETPENYTKMMRFRSITRSVRRGDRNGQR
jgi:pyruvate-formate lyase-activating enzyme